MVTKQTKLRNEKGQFVEKSKTKDQQIAALEAKIKTLNADIEQRIKDINTLHGRLRSSEAAVDRAQADTRKVEKELDRIMEVIRAFTGRGDRHPLMRGPW